MGKVTIVNKSRKVHKCSKCGIPIEVGSKYYKGEINFGPSIIRCNKCGLKSWEVTTSDYLLSVGRIVYEWTEHYPDLETTADEIKEDLQTILEDLEYKLDNMPESLQSAPTGELLQSRIDAKQQAIDDLEDIDIESRKTDAVEASDIADYELEIGGEYDELIERDDISDLVKGQMIEYFQDNLYNDIETILEQLGDSLE